MSATASESRPETSAARRLRSIGPGLSPPGYPNAAATIAALATSGTWQVEDRVSWMAPDLHLWRIARGPWRTRLRLAVRLAFGSLVALLRDCLPAKREILHYVPYPSLFLLWWASWIPRRWRPQLVADAYVSVWDSMFRDRASAAQGWLATGVFTFERRAMRAASCVLVDTVANRDWMASAFGLPRDRIAAVPLALDAAPYLDLPRRKRQPGESLRVIFIGTLIPLHGVQVIADAAVLLGRDCGIELELIGDGQEAHVVEGLLMRDDRLPVTWRRRWASPIELARRIADADVCLGVFGGSGKAARVLPLKLYIAMASARRIVTQDQYSLPDGAPPPPWIAVNASGNALAEALRGLRDEPPGADAAGEELRRYYHRHLSIESLRQRWQELAA